MYGQFSKFIRPGAVRVFSEFDGRQAAARGDVDHVAFVNEDGRHAVVLVNHGKADEGVRVQWGEWLLDVVVCKACVLTVLW
jgi:hypothetical protein